MSADLKLGNIEKSTYLRYHADGLWDIYLGLALLWFGFMILFDQAFLVGIIVPIMLPGVLKTKKSFAESRLGYVEFGPERRSKIQTGRMGMMVLLSFTTLLGALVFMAFSSDSGAFNWVRQLEMLPFGFVLALVLGAVGVFWEMRRFVVYALLILTVFVAARFLHTDLPAVFLFLGGIILIVGIVLLITFMRKYPRAEVTND